ncbi:CsgG/HfaB family protein [Leadbettera azotonutricia]|uniref:Putative lipoprotein n=1 Tax=Leadbettera azotonutricia (strain ATCC BAA-888 / DSM 13862 / ZAS-9) TaxID=545695 RepID=F5Y6L2_LEAAZ|nr:CsgG/HfaB family protein [Leadbettera azotonutricia]AEF82597.1 putative lipoprotein [Leadbettera azotonutricia ZAS-9]
MNILKKMVSLPFLVFMLIGCGSSPKAVASGEGKFLDAAIQEAAVKMQNNLPAGTKVALVSFASTSPQLSEYVISRLEAALVDGKKLIVVDRANLDRIREEQGFQLSGEVSDESAKAIGQLLGAGAIVTGTFTDLGDVYSLTLKAINMETATVAVSYPADIARSTRIQTMLASGGGAAGNASGAAGKTQAPAAPEPPLYKIGDTGPAGGIIFYVKGNNADGWRYLEAAPASTELRDLKWADSNGEVKNTDIGIGSGKQNTKAVIDRFLATGESFRAAQRCDALESGGYDDWYLPSKTELSLMYAYLKEAGIGGFKEDWYWSSSEGDNKGVWTQNFGDGTQRGNGAETYDLYAQYNNPGYKVHSHYVRAIRQF